MKSLLRKILKPRINASHSVPVGEDIENILNAHMEETAKPEEVQQNRTLQDKVFDFIKREFAIQDPPVKLKIALNSNDLPLCVLRSEETPISFWHRLPLKGESGTVHIPDFTLFFGNYRMSPREKAPDTIIECRELVGAVSNRTDTRVVKEVIGLSLDTLPGNIILVTSRKLSNYASQLAQAFGINLVGFEEGKGSSYELFKLIMSDDQPTREALLKILGKNIGKIEHAYKMRKPVGFVRPIENQKAGDKKPSKKVPTVRDQLIKSLNVHPGQTISRLSNVLKIPEQYILNEIYALHRVKKVKFTKKGKGDLGLKGHQWELTKKAFER